MLRAALAAVVLLTPILAWADDAAEPTETETETETAETAETETSETETDDVEIETEDEDEADLADRVRALEALVQSLQERLDAAGSADEAPAEEPVDADLLAELEAAITSDTSDPGQPGLPPPPTPRSPGSQVTPSAMNPSIAFIADVALAYFSNTDEPLQTGAHDPTVNGFNLQQLELAVGASVDPYFRFDANIVFGQFGVEIEEAYATTTGIPGGFQFRIGQFLTRFGRFNNTHPHTWSFVDQPFAHGRYFGGEGNRGLGIEGSVLLPLPWSVELLASATMANGDATALSFFGSRDLGVKTPIDVQWTVAGKQFFPFGPDVGLSWGVSWANGPNGTGRRNRTDIIGTDLYLKVRPVTRQAGWQFTIHAEVDYRRFQIPGDLLQDLSGFAMLNWRFSPRWSVGGRYGFGFGTTNLAGEVVADPTSPAFFGPRHRASVAGTFWPTEFSRVRLQVNADVPTWLDVPAFAAFLAFEFSVGAHGSHAY